MYLQPIKNDDPRLDFYTMYKRETTEYDTEYMQKYNEDLNTTLIFVRLSTTFGRYIALTVLLGRSVLGCQLRLRHRRPVETPARSHRTIRSLPPSHSPQPRPIHCPRRKSHRSQTVGWPSKRDHYSLGPLVCESSDVVASRIRRNVGKAVVESVHPTCRRVDGRTLR